MRSHGPYKIYNHAEQKGTTEIQDKINHQADQRFAKELNQIKSVKEFEKNQFQMAIFKKELLANHSQQLRLENNMENFEFIQHQIESTKFKKKMQERADRIYYKPHFGPEETKDLIVWEQNR